MQGLIMRGLAWFTLNHIEWLVVQCLSNKGLYHALYRAMIKTSTGTCRDKTWDSITLADAMRAFNNGNAP